MAYVRTVGDLVERIKNQDADTDIRMESRTMDGHPFYPKIDREEMLVWLDSRYGIEDRAPWMVRSGRLNTTMFLDFTPKPGW